MSGAYPHRWLARCECGWSTTTYNLYVAEGAVRFHGHLKPDHHTEIVPKQSVTETVAIPRPLLERLRMTSDDPRAIEAALKLLVQADGVASEVTPDYGIGGEEDRRWFASQRARVQENIARLSAQAGGE